MKEGSLDKRQKAFDAAFASYGDELFRHAYWKLSDRERAVDLVQETYLRAFGFASNEDIHDMRAFLYRTLRHLIIDEYRRKKPSSLDAIAESAEAESVEAFLPSDDSNTIEAATLRLDGRAALERVSELPYEYAEVILLRFVDELSPREIASRLDISENLASVRIHRALKALRILLEPDINP